MKTGGFGGEGTRRGNFLHPFPEEPDMIRLFTLALVAGLMSACGAETATTAATAAAVKKQELEQGQKTMEQMQQKIGESMQQMQQSTQRAAD
jgi:outer membrane lipoprotein-sorting protein